MSKTLKNNYNFFLFQVIHSRRETDAGIYWCEAKNELGTARSRNATLQIAGENESQLIANKKKLNKLDPGRKFYNFIFLSFPQYLEMSFVWSHRIHE